MSKKKRKKQAVEPIGEASAFSGLVATSDAPEPRVGSPSRPWRNRLVLVVVVAITALGGAYGVIWWGEAPLREAEQLLAAGKVDQAGERLAGFIERHPQHGRALSVQARIAFQQGRAEETIQLYDMVGASTVEDLHTQARAYLVQGQWSHALPLLEHVTRKDPTNSDALYELTSARQRLGRLRDALESAARFAALPGNEARGYLYLGTLHNDLQNREKALEMFAKVLEFQPDAADLQVRPDEFFVQYGLTLLAAGQVEEAQRMAQRAIAVQSSAEALDLAGRCHEQLGNRQAALEQWRGAVAADPQLAAPREALANDALERRDYDGALKWLQPLTQSPNLSSSTAFLLQRAFQLAEKQEDADKWRTITEQLREKEKVRGAVQSVLLEQPFSYWAEVLRAYQFAERGNYRQAQTMMEVLAKDSSDEPFVQQLAYAVQHGGPLPSLDQLPFSKF